MKSVSHFSKSITISVGFVIFGVVVRLVQYLNNRSIWFDEANLALNIVNRSYFQLLSPLDNNQAAPPGFLWICPKIRLFSIRGRRRFYNLRLPFRTVLATFTAHGS